MKAPTVGIVGNGVVGSALAQGMYRFPFQNKPKVYDKITNRSVNPLHEVLECDVVFLCLPTPQKDARGNLDVSTLEEFFEAHKGYRKLFAIKSTVPVGTTRRLAETYDLPNLVHCPEFLTARTAVDDAISPKAFVVGTPRFNGKNVVSMQGYEPLLAVHKRFHPNCHFVLRSSEESELTKLALNAFYAAKVAWFNELHSLASKVPNVDYDRLVSGMCKAGMLEETHTMVPGPDGKFGFGGACLPKDLRQFIAHFVEYGADPIISSGAAVRNVVDRHARRDTQETAGASPAEASPAQVVLSGEGSQSS